MWRRVSASLPLVIALSFVDVAAQPPADPLTLDAAIAMALQHNRQLKALELEIERAGEELALARLRRLPIFNMNLLASQRLTNLTFEFPAGAFGAFPATGPIPAVDTRLTTPRRPIILAYATAAQPLTQLFRINHGIAASAIGREIARARALSASRELVAAVRRLYYGILQADTAVRAADSAVEAARDLDRVMKERAADRVVLRADAAEAGVRLAQAEQARLTLVHALATQKEQLNQLLGRNPRTAFAAVPVPDPASGGEQDIDSIIRQAVESKSEVREARLRIEQADLDRRAKLSENVPDVSFTVTYFSLFNVDVLPRNLAAAGLQVVWEPWDWGRKRRETAQKVRTIHQARLALQDLENRVALDVLETSRRLEQSRAQMRVAALMQEAARERLRVRTEQFRDASTLPSDVLQAQAQLADAAAKHQQAIAAYWSARADFERAIGAEVKP